MFTRRSALQKMGTGLLAVPGFLRASGDLYHEALFWNKEPGKAVKCTLCPNNCFLEGGQTGICRCRKNDRGTLYSLGYGLPCAVHVDPVEKKPLFHVLPGTTAFSLAVAGCNLRCKYCQNYTISQASPLDTPNTPLSPEAVVAEALRAGCRSIAYTYSEPTVWFEYMYDIARIAFSKGLKNLWITCGYINPEPLKRLIPYLHAANIDIKGFSEIVYRRLNSGRLEPVLGAVKQAREGGVWVEITNLVVPSWTDDPEIIRQLCSWIVDTVGPDVPLHFSRFWPLYQLSYLYPTPTKSLFAARDIALRSGVRHVYIGNLAEADINTYCSKCKEPLIRRSGYIVISNAITNGMCGKCQTPVPGIWR